MWLDVLKGHSSLSSRVLGSLAFLSKPKIKTKQSQKKFLIISACLESRGYHPLSLPCPIAPGLGSAGRDWLLAPSESCDHPCPEACLAGGHHPSQRPTSSRSVSSKAEEQRLTVGFRPSYAGQPQIQAWEEELAKASLGRERTTVHV